MFNINSSDFERLQETIKNYPDRAEKAINEVFRSQEVSDLVYDKIKNLMPKSEGKGWKGKAPHAKDSKSLRSTNENLSLTVRNAKRYQYLYFPNDGTNTKRHRGQQFFFEGGGEAATGDIVDGCIEKIVNNF